MAYELHTGGNSMANEARILVELAAKGPACDGCLGKWLRISPHQQVNQLCNRLAKRKATARGGGRCPRCGNAVLINSTIRPPAHAGEIAAAGQPDPGPLPQSSGQTRGTAIAPRALFDAFSTHIGGLRSAPFVLNEEASFEAWFVVEAYPALLDLGCLADRIERAFTYPGSKRRADLALRGPGSETVEAVFEFKQFVQGQDSTKREEFPKQTKDMELLVREGAVSQAIAIATLFGYGDVAKKSLAATWFSGGGWNIVGPERIRKDHKLELVIGSFTRLAV